MSNLSTQHGKRRKRLQYLHGRGVFCQAKCFFRCGVIRLHLYQHNRSLRTLLTRNKPTNQPQKQYKSQRNRRVSVAEATRLTRYNNLDLLRVSGYNFNIDVALVAVALVVALGVTVVIVFLVIMLPL